MTGAEIAGFLSAQRAAHGIPAGIVADEALRARCADGPALRYGPAEGSWTAEHNPFELAPVHLHQLLDPRLDRVGAEEVDGSGCLVARRGGPPPAADVTYTYPGNGATAWPPAQVAREAAPSPGLAAGIPEGTVTGPHLYVSFDGPDLPRGAGARTVSAALSGPGGAVDVAVVDNETPGLTGYLPTGMQLIPREPLAPLTSYRAAVAADVETASGRRRFAHTWAFTTGLARNAVTLAAATVRDGRLSVAASSAAPDATVAATGPGTAAGAVLGPGGTAELDLDDAGFWTVCVRSGGGSTAFEEGEACADVGVPREGADQVVDVPRTTRRNRAFDLRIGTEVAVDVAYRVVTRGGLQLVRGGRQTLQPGTWSLPVRVPGAYDDRGRRVLVRIQVFDGGQARLVRRGVRFR